MTPSVKGERAVLSPALDHHHNVNTLGQLVPVSLSPLLTLYPHFGSL